MAKKLGKPDILSTAQELFEKDRDAWSEVYQKARDDLYFLSDEEYAQWDSNIYKARLSEGRPIISIDQLGQFIHQVANDIRQNTPTINVLPSDDGDVETAEIYKGIIKGIEYESNADDVYDTAANNAIRCSIGFIRIEHDYVNNNGFEQTLRLRRVINPLACFIDSDSIECDGRDAKHATILEDISQDEFKRRWPKNNPSSFTGKNQRRPKSGENVTVAEFFIIENNQSTITEGDLTRQIDNPKVKRYWLSGEDVLEEGDFPGEYIPLVPVYGEEDWIDGKRCLLSLIRKSKDAQMMFNIWASLETELLMKQPQAPVMAAAGSVEPYIKDWAKPGKAAVLRFDHIDKNGNQVPPPQRLDPPTIPTGIVNAKRESVDDIKASLGMYSASIGAKSNETSGVAIANRQREGDVATYHFADNLNRSIAQCGRILVCAIPETIDTPRVVRTIDIEGNPKPVGVNGMRVPGQDQTFDLTMGKYDVRVVTGASYTTKRQETAAALQQVFQAAPEAMMMFMDIYFKNSDFSGAEALAERAKKIIAQQNPSLVEDNENQDPAVAALQQQNQQLQAQLAQAAQALQDKQADTQLKQQEMILKNKDIELKGVELEQKGMEAKARFVLDKQKLDNEALSTRLQAKASLSPDAQLADGELHEDGIAPMDRLMAQFATAMTQSNQLLAGSVTQMAEAQRQTAQAIVQGDAVLAAAITKPKRIEYAENGRIAGVK